MSFSQINQLRKSGQLRQAWLLAHSQLQTNGNDIWNLRAMAWVLYDYAKLNATFPDFDRFIKCLQQINSLQLPPDETLFWDNTAWLIRAMVATCQRNKHHQPSQFSLLLDTIAPMPLPKPSLSWSALLQTTLRLKNEWNRFPDFCLWWNFQNLRPADYQPTPSSSGRPILPLAERAFMAFSKAILTQNRHDDMLQWEPQLNSLAAHNPSFIYLPYYLAKIRIAIGKPEQVFDTMKNLVLKKRNEFWIWELLGDSSSNPDTRFCLHSKAISCPAKDEMTVTMREKILLQLIQRNHLPQAKTELDHLLSTRRSHNWNIPQPLLQMQQTHWYSNTLPDPDIKQFYLPYAQKAEKLILGDTQTTTTGTLRKKPNGIGFVNNIFVPPHLIQKIENGATVTVSAIKSFDKKKKQWGWKAIKILPTPSRE